MAILLIFMDIANGGISKLSYRIKCKLNTKGVVLYFNLFVYNFITAKYPCLKVDMTCSGTKRIVLLYTQYRTCESVASISVVRVRLSVCLCCTYVLHTGAMYSVVRVCSFVCLCCLYCFIVCFVFSDTLFIYNCKINPL